MHACINQDIVARTIEDRMLLIPTSGEICRQGAIVILNYTAQQIWEIMSSSKIFTKKEIILFLQEEYRESNKIESDVNLFWNFLLEHELIVLVEGSSMSQK